MLVLDQHLTHGPSGQTQVLEEPLKLWVRLRMRLNQFADVAGKLRIGVFGLWSAGARSISNDLAGVVFLDALGASHKARHQFTLDPPREEECDGPDEKGRAVHAALRRREFTISSLGACGCRLRLGSFSGVARNSFEHREVRFVWGF